MSMRITIQVTCDTPEDAKDAINRLTRPKTWVDDVESSTRLNAGRETGANTDSGKKVDNDEARHSSHPTTRTTSTGSSAKGAEQSGDNEGVTGAPRPNISPGEPAIGKIGGATREYLLNELKAGDRTTEYKDFHKFKEHLKLLWSRGEVKFDGDEYYL
jgi:hypothetical protein